MWYLLYNGFIMVERIKFFINMIQIIKGKNMFLRLINEFLYGLNNLKQLLQENVSCLNFFGVGFDGMKYF